ncbi:MAG TPA: cyanophycin synthetase, partial [Polyangia bacterium]|nr:cyanophycin synthetase [Polyangia bacterium]
RSTVAELVTAENERRVGSGEGARTGLLRIDLDAVFCLQNQGLRPSSVLADGERVAVKTVINQNGPDDNVNAREEVSEELLADAVAAARVIGVRLAGVDLITPDPSRSLREGGGAIIEVNGTPGLHYHYNGAGPEEQESVAVAILERALAGESQSG